MSVGLTEPMPEPEYEPRESVSPEAYLEAVYNADNHIPQAGVIPHVFNLLASSADVASIYERIVRKGGPLPKSKVVKDRVLRDLGGVLRNVVLVGHFYGFTLRDIIDADYDRLVPEDEPE
jgi:hypothetical protein